MGCYTIPAADQKGRPATDPIYPDKALTCKIDTVKTSYMFIDPAWKSDGGKLMRQALVVQNHLIHEKEHTIMLTLDGTKTFYLNCKPDSPIELHHLRAHFDAKSGLLLRDGQALLGSLAGGLVRRISSIERFIERHTSLKALFREAAKHLIWHAASCGGDSMASPVGFFDFGSISIERLATIIDIM